MSVRFVLWLLVVVFSVSVVSAGLNVGYCRDPDTDEDLKFSVCGGSSLNSLEGFGAVELCSDCYICGVSDGVCPEDFNVSGVPGNCSRCPDPDCLVRLTGKVHVDGQSDTGIRDASVSAQLLHYPGWREFTNTTNNNGEYVLWAPRGVYKVVASAVGYDIRVIDFPMNQGFYLPEYELNISMTNGSCHVDCTGFEFFGEPRRCSARCEGYSVGDHQCVFRNVTIIQQDSDIITYFARDVCDGLLKDSKRVVEMNATHSLVANCCTGDFEWELRPRINVQSSDRIKNLVRKQYLLPITGEANPGRLVIVAYSK